MTSHILEPAFPGGDIEPGKTKRGNVTFEVPVNVGAMSLEYVPENGDKVVLGLQ